MDAVDMIALGLRSWRGLPLVRSGAVSTPTLTVELYCKWYDLALIRDGRVERVPYDELPDKPERSTYCDHVPNPCAVRELCADRGWHLDELAEELIVGRWTLEAIARLERSTVSELLGAAL